ncbi:MAG: flagellar hook-length control protein FliK [Xanthobacteraceae bacterium]
MSPQAADDGADATNADTATANNPQAASDTAQPGAATANGTNAASALATAVATAAADALNAAADTGATQASATKATAKDDKGDSADPGTTAEGAAQISQPVAAAIVLATADSATATANAQTTSDEQAKSRVKALPASGTEQKALVQDAKNTSAGQQSTATQTPSDGHASGAPDSASASLNSAPDSQQAATGAQSPQAQAQAGNSVTVLAQATVPGSADLTGSRSALAATTISSSAGQTNGQTAGGVVGPNGLPNFGLLAANATTSTSAAAAPATGSDATVPLAGLAVAISARAQAGSNQFSIRLDPPELGRIDVRLDVDSSGQATAHVTVDRPDTLQLLQSQQPQLQQALDQSGLKTANNGLQFTLRDQSFAGQNGNGGGYQQNTPPRPQLVIADAGLAPVGTAQIYSRLSLRSGLDIRV